MAQQRLAEIKKTRLQKIAKLKKSGINPYPSELEKKPESISSARKRQGKEVIIAGRLLGWREHGNVIFADIKDESGQVQLFFQKKSLQEDFKTLSLFDIGDFILVEGSVFETEAGETTVNVDFFQLLAKSVRPLPSTWHGLKDVEERYRQRYVDLLLNEEVRSVFTKKAKIVSLLRGFLDKKGFLEVTTPALQPIYGGATARPFITHHNALDTDLFLRISDELYLKRLIVGGFDRVYELCTDFRNEGIDRWHNPEFTQLVQRIVDEGFPLLLFSNGLIPPEALSYLTEKNQKKLSLIININQPEDNSSREWREITHSLAALGERAGLGYNIYKVNPELEFMLELIDKYKLSKYIRLSITQPILKAKNAYLPLENYFALAPKLVDFAAQCDKHDIKLAFDCGFILCMFNEAELGKLYTYNVNLGFYCEVAIDIGPGLELWHCFPLSSTYTRRLTEFKHYKEIVEFYKQKFEPFTLFGSLPKCRHCKYRRRQQCNGGCLSHKMKAFHL